jgi:apolipoprotein N-acyltransferase
LTLSLAEPFVDSLAKSMHRLRVGISWRDALASAGSALLGAAAFSPLSFWPLALVSSALFLWLIRARTTADARVIGLVYGLVYGLGTMYWLFGIFGFLAVSFVFLGEMNVQNRPSRARRKSRSTRPNQA